MFYGRHLSPDPVAGMPLAKPVQIHLRLDGHLSEAVLLTELNRADHELLNATQQPVLVVECLTMTGYDSAARSLFVEWNSRQKSKFICVVVVTANKLWHMVVSSMALASSQRMKAFSSLAAAETWIFEQASRAHLAGG